VTFAISNSAHISRMNFVEITGDRLMLL